jgi:hypothetical protein
MEPDRAASTRMTRIARSVLRVTVSRIVGDLQTPGMAAPPIGPFGPAAGAEWPGERCRHWPQAPVRWTPCRTDPVSLGPLTRCISAPSASVGRRIRV